MQYRAISNTISHSLTAKQKDRLLSFLILNVIEAKIFHHVFLEGHNVWENNRYWSSTQWNVLGRHYSILWKQTKPEFLVAKDEILAALVTGAFERFNNN